MRAVLLMRRRADAEEQALARFTVSAAGEPALVDILAPELGGLQAIIDDGAPDGNGHLLTVEDGDAYLDALLMYYRGSRFWAEEVDSPDG